MTLSKETLEEIAELARKATYNPCAMHITNLVARCDSEVVEEMIRELLERRERDGQETVSLGLLSVQRARPLTSGRQMHSDDNCDDCSHYRSDICHGDKCAAPPAPVVTSEPVRYMNRFTGACFTLDQQPDAATDTAVYVPLYTEQPAPDDYFASLVSKARPAAEKAMRKFPQPNYVLLKVAEEAGEVVQAGVHYAERRMSWEQVEGEIVQLLAMLIRLVTEGDQINGVTPPEHTRAAAPQQEANQ